MLAKKGTTTPTSLSYGQALDEALCSGWIDGQLTGLDSATYRQRFTPRRRRSLWSARNVGIVARLIEEGRMRPRGFAEIDSAKADGRWDAAYAGQATIQMPDDLAAVLAETPSAQAMFDTLSAQNRYAVLLRVSTARTAQTRRNRIDTSRLAPGCASHVRSSRPRPAVW
jgi:uncharacterized protein YdeI (YjbR/CyaY-like superfamily)